MPTADLIYLIVISLGVLCFLIVGFFVVRYWMRTLFSEKWPRATATISRDFVGYVGKGSYGSYFRYTFNAEGGQFSGRFLIIDNADHAKALQDKLDGLPIEIKYKSKKPKVSLVAEIYDPRLDGRVTTQNPYWLLHPRELDGFISLNPTAKKPDL
jgi:uncharacterized protein YneF (UPF0154 family)